MVTRELIASYFAPGFDPQSCPSQSTMPLFREGWRLVGFNTPYASQRCTNLGVTAAIALAVERTLGKGKDVGSNPTGGLVVARHIA